LKEQQLKINKLVQSLEEGKQLNTQLKASLQQQQQLLDVQQRILKQTQADRAAMEQDIKLIKHSLGLEAKN
jgi:hypothetical protein